jgi:hypothetical protein
MRHAFLIVLAALVVAAPAVAAPRLDPSFAGGGIVPLPEGLDPSGMVLTDDTILLAGDVDDGVAFSRFSLDGELDPTFGVGGLVAIPSPLHAQSGYGFEAGGVFLGHDGRPTVAYGDLASGHTSPSAPCLASVDSTGSLASAVSGVACGKVWSAPVLPRSGGGRFQVGTPITAFTAQGGVDRAWGHGGRWRAGHNGFLEAISPDTGDGLVLAIGYALPDGHGGLRVRTELRRLDDAGRATTTFALPQARFPPDAVSRLVRLADGTFLAIGTRGRRLQLARIALRGRRSTVSATASRRLPHRVEEVAAISRRGGALLVATVDDPPHLYEDFSPGARLVLLPLTGATRIGAPRLVGPVVADGAEVVGLAREPDDTVVVAVSAGYAGGHMLLGVRDD